MATVVETESLPKKKLRFRLQFHERREVYRVERTGEGERLRCKARVLDRRSLNAIELQAADKELKEALKSAASVSDVEAVEMNSDLSNFDVASSRLASALEFNLSERLEILEGWSLRQREVLLLELVYKNVKVLKLRKQLRQRTQQRLQRLDREALLQEERKVIDQELGRGQKNIPSELQALSESIALFDGPDEVNGPRPRF